MEENKILERIIEANNHIKPFVIERNQKQKDGSYKMVKTNYATVSERIKAFRYVYPSGRLESISSFTENYIMFETRAYDNDGKLLAIAHARELAKKDFAYEVAETSSYGRCIGLCGIGMMGGLASADDMQNYDDKQIFNSEQMEKDKKLKEEAIAKFNKLNATQKANILNLFKTKDVATINTDTLLQLVANAK